MLQIEENIISFRVFKILSRYQTFHFCNPFSINTIRRAYIDLLDIHIDHTSQFTMNQFNQRMKF